MKAEILLSLSHEDVKKMPFAALHEYSTSSYFKSLTQKIKRNKFFTSQELEELPKYQKKAAYFYHNPSMTMRMSPEEYKMWDRIGKFLYENWCIH